MIRVLRGFLTILTICGLLAAWGPVTAQAEIFIKKQSSEGPAAEGEAEKPAKKGVFVPLKNLSDKIFSPYKAQKTAERGIGTGLSAKDLKEFDIGLLTAAGGEPKTTQDLIMIATAHNAVKNEGLRALRATQVQAPNVSASAGREITLDPTRTISGQSDSTGTASALTSTGKVTKPKVFAKPEDREKKSGGVFKNY